MKNAIKGLVMTAAMAALSMVGTLQASSLSEHKADVAFGFRVGNDSMPAGKYSIAWNDRNVFRFRHVETGRMVMFLGPVNKDAPEKGGSLTFRCNGEICVLEAVKPFGSNVQFGRLMPAIPRGSTSVAAIEVALR